MRTRPTSKTRTDHSRAPRTSDPAGRSHNSLAHLHLEIRTHTNELDHVAIGRALTRAAEHATTTGLPLPHVARQLATDPAARWVADLLQGA